MIPTARDTAAHPGHQLMLLAKHALSLKSKRHPMRRQGAPSWATYWSRLVGGERQGGRALKTVSSELAPDSPTAGSQTSRYVRMAWGAH